MDFNEYAKHWDTDKRIQRAKLVADEIANSIDRNELYSAMEYGCGTGLVSFNLCDKFKTITMIDSSIGMIDILNSKINNTNIKNMITKNIDLSSPNIHKSSADIEIYDIIYNSMVLHHIHNIKEIVKNFYQQLNKHGYLCIVDLDEEDGSFHRAEPDFDGHNGFNQEELKNILLEVGFHDIESHTFYYDQKVVEDDIIEYSLFLMTARK